MPTDNNNPVVFISYAHEGDMSARVIALAVFLTDNGVQVLTDHPYLNRPPEQGWRAWMQHSAEDADFVLVVCTERYKRLFEKRPVEDAGGLGVTWEGAILSAELFANKLINKRIYPILPDEGDHSHIPAVLSDFYNNHRFPGGNQRILDLITIDIDIPKPQGAPSRYRDGELQGISDNRIQPREGEVLGREAEVEQVLDFLQGSSDCATVCGHVVGTAGIGKTEVCKQALLRWLESDRASRVFYIKVHDHSDTSGLIGQLGQAISLDQEILATINEIDGLRRYLPSGLYYLDNLESIAETAEGKQALRDLTGMPGIRVLASSRVSLDGVLGQSIEVDVLDIDDAVTLFCRCWNGKVSVDKESIKNFVNEQLGRHALSISLVARLGKARSLQDLQKRWEAMGTSLTHKGTADSKYDNLDISFELTAEQLSTTPGALDLWQLAGLFPVGMPKQSMYMWEQSSKHEQAVIALIDHHILTYTENLYSMLPPIVRYALNQFSNQMLHGLFDREQVSAQAYRLFLQASARASDTQSSAEITQSRNHSCLLFPAIDRLLAIEASIGCQHKDEAVRLHHQLRNVYQFSVLTGRKLLRTIEGLLGDPLSNKLLGDLESRLGNLDQARARYNTAIELYEKGQAKLGLADALKALGDLEFRLGNLDPARAHFNTAKELYEKGQAKLGLADALQALGGLEIRLGNLDTACAHLNTAKELYEKGQAKLGLASALKALGDLEIRLGNLDQARARYNTAKELYEKGQANLGLANALKALGDLEIRLGNLDQARARYNTAIELYEKEQDQLGLADALKALGDLEFRLGNLDQARAHLNTAIELYEKGQANLGLANALKALGDLEIRLGNLDQARAHLNTATGLYEKEQDQLGLANALLALGGLEIRLGNLDPARAHLNTAIELYEKEQAKLGLANAYLSIGALFLFGQNQPQQALTFYLSAKDLFSAEQNPTGLAYTLAEEMRCQHWLSTLDTTTLKIQAKDALLAAQQSGVESVVHYVLRALYQVLDEDEAKLQQFIEKLE